MRPLQFIRRRTTLAFVLAACALALAAPATGASGTRAAVPPSLLDAAAANPKQVFDVIVQGDGSDGSEKLARRVAKEVAKSDGGDDAKVLATQLRAQFSSISGIEIQLSGRQLVKLADAGGLVSITPNASVTAEGSGYANPQRWPTAVHTFASWTSSTQAATIAVVDSGVDNSTGNFGNRLVASVDLGGGRSSGDGRGHGTMVAAIAASSGQYSGVAPTAKIVSLNVFDDQGRGTIGNVIAACDWILQHKDEYGIRVANFSLSGSLPSSFMYDPLDQAVERLWQAGVVVTVAAGNYASNSTASGVLFAPANDPFVITVGAIDIQSSWNLSKHHNAPWSAFGYTPDGFAKPELGAPGRYMTAQVPQNATLLADFPTHILAPGTIQLSGTSFAAPVVAGTAAQLLGVHPTWTPDQVKGALMDSAHAVSGATQGSVGVGETDVQNALAVTSPSNPNLALNQFLVSDPAGGSLPVFDSAGWSSAARSGAAWSSAGWSSASWSSAAWSSAAWSSAGWSSAAWSSAGWSSDSWLNNAAADSTGPG
jgi:serine protease AprX